MFQSISVIFLVALIAGCSGGMNGVLRGSGEQVSVASYAGLCLDSLQIIMPDGETFIGYIPTPEGDGEADPFCVSPYKVAASGSFESGGDDPDSILFSDRLNMMRCEINFRKPGIWGAASGAGTCQLSDNRVVDVQ